MKCTHLQVLMFCDYSVPDEEPIYEEIDHLMVLMDEICSEGEPDNLQPVCNAISKVMFYS